jgi:hypothetical protein
MMSAERIMVEEVPSCGYRFWLGGIIAVLRRDAAVYPTDLREKAAFSRERENAALG